MDLKKEGKDPQALRDRPILTQAQVYYAEAFEAVTDSRRYAPSGIPLPVPMSEIKSYFETFYIDSLTERELLVKMIQAQDRAFVKVVGEKIAAKQKKPDK